MELKGKTAIVTGGGRGIGEGIARVLAREGASVVVMDRNGGDAETVAKSIREAGGSAMAVVADVTDLASLESMVRTTEQKFGGLDILVNNAGIWKGSPVDEMTDAEWEETMAINMTGTFFCTRAAVPFMKNARWGRIINISSTAGQRGEAFHSHYAASKGAMISFTKSLAVELAPHGITVNCVAPGWVATDMSQESLLGPEREAILATIPLGRVARPEEIAGAVAFLASDLASFVTGEILNVNGGAVLVG